MAHQLFTFMLPEDEETFVRVLARSVFEVYPRRVPPDWQTFRLTLDAMPQLPERDVYLVASDLGPAHVDAIKRGPDKGFWRIDEVRSPVLFWERSARNEDGEVLSGQLWAELDITEQTGRKQAAPAAFRARVLELSNWLTKTFRKGDPKGSWIGPAAARAVKDEGLVLREDFVRNGRIVVPQGMTRPKAPIGRKFRR
ncbi:MAG: hypothetical protein MUC96_05045 [Myxococcaceae bacterium]|jgi:hypothetical protein|nr:hypothetical protein [Myxococcaceae bacterium]